MSNLRNKTTGDVITDQINELETT